MTTGQLVLILAGLGVGLWVMHKIGQALTKVLEAVAAAAAVFVTLWLLIKGTWWVGRQVARHWRTSLTTAAVLAWLYWWGWPSLMITLAVVTVGLLVWRWVHRESFAPWAGRHLRGWWAPVDGLRPTDAALAARLRAHRRRSGPAGHRRADPVPPYRGAAAGQAAP